MLENSTLTITAQSQTQCGIYKLRITWNNLLRKCDLNCNEIIKKIIAPQLITIEPKIYLIFLTGIQCEPFVSLFPYKEREYWLLFSIL